VPFGDAEAVERTIHSGTVGVMVEPIQGEAGVVVPPAGYLQALRAITERHGILLILDEIQTGMGRTGKLFAFEHEGVRPDILTLGKGLGGGIPLAATLNRSEISCFAPGDQGGTFAGHPLTTAVGLAVLRELTAPGFLEHVVAAGEHLRAGLMRLAGTFGSTEARGAGLLQALGLPKPRGAEVVSAALSRGLLINAPQPTLLRFMPALNVSLPEIDEMLVLLEQSLREAL
jgi:acetylornithine/N-succinyldiaminopimelate aminotransferase